MEYHSALKRKETDTGYNMDNLCVHYAKGHKPVAK